MVLLALEYDKHFSRQTLSQECVHFRAAFLARPGSFAKALPPPPQEHMYARRRHNTSLLVYRQALVLAKDQTLLCQLARWGLRG